MTMLSRNGTKHPLHKLKLPALDKTTTQPILCSFCQTYLFNSSLCENLTDAVKYGCDPDKWTCARKANEFRSSILQGCKFCVQLGQGVLTAAHLDYWQEKWDGSNSDSDFGSDIGEKETPNQLDDGDDQIPINSELDYKEDDAPAAAQFGVSENALKFFPWIC